MNTDTTIYGFLVVVPEIGGYHFSVVCPECMDKRHGKGTQHDTILRSADNVTYPAGIECVYCTQIVFYPLPKNVTVEDAKYNPFAIFIETLDI